MNNLMCRFSAVPLILGSLFVPSYMFATAQRGDILILDGKKFGIQVEPLRGFLEANPGKLPKSDVVSTSNWRGYIATWEVREGRLILTDVTVEHSVTKPGERGFSTEPRSVMSELFPGEKEVPASWFSGHLVVPNGKLVHYVHMGYASVFEKYIILRVERGVVTRRQDVNTADFLKFRDAQFSAFKKTKEYREAFDRSLKEDDTADRMGPKKIEEFLREFYSGRYLSMIFDDAEK